MAVRRVLVIDKWRRADALRQTSTRLFFYFNSDKSGSKIALKPRLTCLDKCRTAGGKQQGTEAPLPAEPHGQSAALSISPLLFRHRLSARSVKGRFSFPVSYPQLTRNLLKVTKTPTATYPQASRGGDALCPILPSIPNGKPFGK